MNFFFFFPSKKNFGNGVWTPELKQIDEIRKLSKKLGGESGLKRQKEAGKVIFRFLRNQFSFFFYLQKKKMK